MKNALTVDVEDYFQVQSFEHQVSRDSWSDYESRVVRNTRCLLELFAKHNVLGTFYILGWVAKHYPELVKEIDDAGHEVGCHSFWHRLIYEQTPEEFREDLRLATQTIEDAIGKPVTTFRAPCFSITGQSLWALDILIEEGYQTDSSIFPVHHDRYGIPGAERFPHQLARANGQLQEFPMTAVRFGKLNVPVAGGGYFRLYPFSLTQRLLRSINKQSQPFVFYIHPWEIDPEQPRLPGSWKTRFRHYVGLERCHQKLDQLLTTFEFTTTRQALALQASHD